MSLEALTADLRAFAIARDWEQFHTPKNLAMALAGEAGELLAEFQWLTTEQSEQLDDKQFAAVAEEMADVLIYLCRLSDVLGIDLEQATADKAAANAQRYSVEVSRGNADKVEKA
ncbi:MAG: nucleotide pyrophosphohydrolase [Candidatus Nanopelagicales bacterium]